MTELPRQPVRLQLFAGPLVAVPAPRFVVDALREVTVESGSGMTQSGFELVFDVPKKSPLTTLFLLSGGAAVPVLRIVVAVTVGLKYFGKQKWTVQGTPGEEDGKKAAATVE